MNLDKCIVFVSIRNPRFLSAKDMHTLRYDHMENNN